jgi:hypothetical protein
MKPNALEKFYMVGLSGLSGIFLSASVVLIAFPEAKSGEHEVQYVTLNAVQRGDDVYLPARFVREERNAQEAALPPQF